MILKGNMAREAPAELRHTGAESRAPRWAERLIGEIRRGRHVILYGNLRDLVRWNEKYHPIEHFLSIMLQDELKYPVIAWYNPFEGLDFRHGRDEGQQLFESDGPLLARQLPSALGQRTSRIAFVWDFADLSLSESLPREDRQLLAWMDTAMRTAVFIDGYPNVLILLARDLDRIPSWLFRGNPFVSAVPVERPSTTERRLFVTKYAGSFLGGVESSASDGGLERAAEHIAALTEGMSLHDLFLISRTSHLEELPLTEAKELVSTYVFGSSEDPWEQLPRSTFRRAQEIIGREVIGQDAALAQVAKALTAAASGIDYDTGDPEGETRPRAVFFLVGPTGVGKTETAKEIASLVFGDRTQLMRFDMSEYKEQHSAERLTGAPPGFVGFERGGQLVQRVLDRPFSVLLFDEIEKAHPLVLDRFLQILDDGRLTDGQGRTAYFRNCVIIFTSNEGSTGIHERMQTGPGGATMSYEDVDAHYRDAVEIALVQRVNRPELWARLGDGVIVFDLLRPETARGIAIKFLERLRNSAEDQGIHLDVDDSVAARIVDHYGSTAELLRKGGRGIREAVDKLVRYPLAEWVMETQPKGKWRVSLERQDRLTFADGQSPEGAHE